MESNDTPIWREKDVSRSETLSETLSVPDIVELFSSCDDETIIDMYSGKFESDVFLMHIKHVLKKRE